MAACHCRRHHRVGKRRLQSVANQATARDGRGIRPPCEGREEGEGLDRHRALSEVRTRLESPGTEAQAQFTAKSRNSFTLACPRINRRRTPGYGAGDLAWASSPRPHALADLKPVRDLHPLVARLGSAGAVALTAGQLTVKLELGRSWGRTFVRVADNPPAGPGKHYSGAMV